MCMDKIIKHKDAYLKSFKNAIVGEEYKSSSTNVESSSPYYVELNEENEISKFAYEVGKTVRDNVSISGGSDNSGDGGNNGSVGDYDNRYALKDHNHDEMYAKLVHNHDDRYYTKSQEDEWRDRLINGDLLFNKITANHIQAGAIVAGSTIIANGAIGSAQISKVSADKLDAGVIDTSKITIAGANGNLKLRGNRLQVFEGIGANQYERVSLGDVNNDGTIYGLRVRGADGNTILYDENGVYREGITDGSINDDKIAGDANIDGGKLNIHSVITNINENNTGTIHGTKVDIDGESVTSKVYNIILNQNEHSETMERQQSEINQNREQIELKVSNQKYTEDMTSMTSKLEKAESDIELLNEGIKLTVSKTEVENQINSVKDFVSSEIGDISIGGANYLNNSAPRKATVDELITWDRTLNGTRRLTYWQDYNENVELPQAGYHPHIDLETFHFPCIALINRNGTFGMANRELCLKHEINKAEEVIIPKETYILSFDAYVDTANFSFNGGLYHRVVESTLYDYYSGHMDIVFSKDDINTWKRVSYIFDVRVGVDISNPVYLNIYAHNNPEGSSYIKNIKLEKSNVPSQWTPSQFDVDDSLDDIVNNMKDYTNESIKNYNSSVDVKFDSITSRVEYTESTVDDVYTKYTEIKQTLDGIDITGKVSFYDLATSGRTEIHGGNIKANTLSINSLSSNNSNPIIKLFPTVAADGTESYCSIDATKQYEQGVGSAIRLKWDSMNYMLQKRKSVDFYMEPREVGSAFGFQSDYGQYVSNYESRIITKDGTLCFRRSKDSDEHTSSLYFYTGSQNYTRKLLTSFDLSSSVSSTSTTDVATSNAVKLAYDKAVSAYNVGNHSHPYASSSHSHSNYASSSYFTGGSSTTKVMNGNSSNYIQLYGGSEVELRAGSARLYVTNYSAYVLYPSNSGTDLGTSSNRWRTVYATNSLNTSDKKFKENIKYVDDSKTCYRSFNDETPYLDFIKDDLKVATYTYSTRDKDGYNPLANDQIGFIANDIADTKVGRTFIYDYGEEDGYMFSPTGYTTVVAKALQEEIKKREALEERVKQLEEIVNKLLEKGDE